MQDFTMSKYKELCLTLLSNNYTPLTVYSYLKMERQSNDRLIMLRHDVDRKPDKALQMAKLESDLGIKSTYYFRCVKGIFNLGIMARINSYGHEIGYHYEVLSKAKGDYEKAIELFRRELDEFKKICKIQTICMHGSPLSRYDNRDLWKRYDFKEFGLAGEAYLSIKDVSYFSDTGRSWNWKNKVRDFLQDNKNEVFIQTTDELIKLIKENKIGKLYLLVHPERWSSNYYDWLLEFAKDYLFNIGKSFLKRSRGEIVVNQKI